MYELGIYKARPSRYTTYRSRPFIRAGSAGVRCRGVTLPLTSALGVIRIQVS